MPVAFRQIYRQTYRPGPSIRLPRWAMSLWNWL